MTIIFKKGMKALTILAMFVFALPALADNYGLDTANSTAGLPPGKGSTATESIAIGAGNIMGAVLAFLGVIFLALMIYGGVLWMTVPSNEKGVKKAKMIISAAVIGLLIVLSAYAVTAYLGDVLAK
ncbi:MAG: hypothetical protein V1865_00245 [bacterium]